LRVPPALFGDARTTPPIPAQVVYRLRVYNHITVHSTPSARPPVSKSAAIRMLGTRLKGLKPTAWLVRFTDHDYRGGVVWVDRLAWLVMVRGATFPSERGTYKAALCSFVDARSDVFLVGVSCSS
jgi:hypothetical protein